MLIARQDILSLKTSQLLTFRFHLAISFWYTFVLLDSLMLIQTSSWCLLLEHVFPPNQTPGTWAWVPSVSVWVWEHGTKSWLSLLSLLSLLHQIAFPHGGYGALSPRPAWTMSHRRLFLLSNNCYQVREVCPVILQNWNPCAVAHGFLQKASLVLSFWWFFFSFPNLICLKEPRGDNQTVYCWP